MVRSSGKTVALAIAAALGVGTGAGAQQSDEERHIFTLQVENDVFNRVSPSDKDYTSGFRVGWLSPALADLPRGLIALTTIPAFFGESPTTSVVRRIGVSVGQNLYTPEDTWASFPIYDDRPYAAWLYASFALQGTYKRRDSRTGKEEPVRLDTLQLDLGLIGPSAGGEFVQNNYHTLIGVPRSFGWANQLHDEPTVGLTFERRWRVGRWTLFDDPRLEYDIIPWLGAAVGNVATYAGAGGILRIGRELRNDFGPARARPALPGSEGFIGEGFGWYFFIGVGGEAVARNIFLDGNSDGNSLRVGHRAVLGEAQAGLAVMFRGVRLTYTQVLRTPEFFERERATLFGSINLTFRY